MRLYIRPLSFATYLATVLFPATAFAAFTGPVELIPAQFALPEPWGLLKLLLLLTFAVHLLLVNILIGSCLLALTGCSGCSHDASVPSFSLKEDTAFIPKILALTINLGVAPYLFMQVLYGSFFYPSTLLMATWWMAIIGLVMLSYYGLYIVSDRSTNGVTRLILASLTIMLCFTAFILSNNSTLMLRPDLWPIWLTNPDGTVLNTADPTLFPRYLHIFLACMAVGGLAHACRGVWNAKKSAVDAVIAEERVQRGLVWFRRATLSQLPVGLWFFLSLPPEVRGVFMGGSAIATTAFVLALAGAVLTLVFAYRERVYAASAVTASLVFVMVVVRDIVRDASLAAYFAGAKPGESVPGKPLLELPLAKGQDEALILFIACFGLAVGILIWMTKAIAAAMRKAPSRTDSPLED